MREPGGRKTNKTGERKANFENHTSRDTETGGGEGGGEEEKEEKEEEEE